MSRWSHAHPENPQGPITPEPYKPVNIVKERAEAMLREQQLENWKANPSPGEQARMDAEGELALAANDAQKEQEQRYIEHGPELVAAARELGRKAKHTVARVGDHEGGNHCALCNLWLLLAKVEGK